MIDSSGSLTSDFRAKASSAEKRDRYSAKQKSNRRNQDNRRALGDWNRELANSGNRRDIPRPIRLGGYKNA